MKDYNQLHSNPIIYSTKLYIASTKVNYLEESKKRDSSSILSTPVTKNRDSGLVISINMSRKFSF